MGRPDKGGVRTTPKVGGGVVAVPPLPCNTEAMQLPDPVEVLVVDDQQPFRLASSDVVEATNGFVLWGTAASGPEAIASVREVGNPPSLVLMDVNLGEVSGIESTRRMIELWPEMRIVLVSTMAEYDLPADASTCGAQGYVPKSKLSPHVLTALVEQA